MFIWKLLAFCVAVLLYNHRFGGPSPAPPKREKYNLTFQEQKDKVVIAWTGEVEEPMHTGLAAMFEKFKRDPRALVLTLNSPGGRIAHGHDVMELMSHLSQSRSIETHVPAGATCASMCVPIFLMGTSRTAHAKAKFMFHEASVSKAGAAKAAASNIDEQLVKMVGTELILDVYLRQDRVDDAWVEGLREKIKGRDYWISAKDLMASGSGMIDRLVP